MIDLKDLSVDAFIMLDDVYGSEGLDDSALIYNDGVVDVSVPIPDDIIEAVEEENGDVWESRALYPLFEALLELAIEAQEEQAAEYE